MCVSYVDTHRTGELTGQPNSYLDTQINKSSKMNSTDNVKFLRLPSQGNIERLEGFSLVCWEITG
jgi:hypothetical protein